jgi:hypothetical protein
MLACLSHAICRFFFLTTYISISTPLVQDCQPLFVASYKLLAIVPQLCRNQWKRRCLSAHNGVDIFRSLLNILDHRLHSTGSNT